MRLRLAFSLSLLTLGLACGSSGGADRNPAPATALPAGTAATLTAAVLGLESGTAATSLPSLAPAGEGAFALIAPPTPGCVSVANHGTGTDGFTEWVWTFNCTGPEGGSLTGTVTLRFNPQGIVNVAYSNFRMAKATQSWTYNGSRSLAWNPSTRQAAVTVTGLSLVLADSANPAGNATYVYNAAYTVDASQATTPRLWGGFSFAANATTTTGTIPADKALTWSPGCCHPVAGTLLLTQGGLGASVAFTQPCGTIQVTPTGQAPVTHALPACLW